MATRANTAASTEKKSDGFVNFRVTAKDGSVHSFKFGIPLSLERKLDKAIIQNPSLLETAMKEGRLTFSVWVAGADADSEIDL
jgi:hypothetical protein